MIDVTESPNFISFAGNPLIYEACSDNCLIALGSRASFELLVSSVDTVEGHAFHLQFAGKALVFQTASFTGFDGLLFEVGYPGQTFNDFADNIYQCFLENYEIQKFYNVALGPVGTSERKITLQARKSGSDGTVVFTNIDVAGVGQGASVPGSDDQYRDYFGVLCLVRDAAGNPIGEDIKPADFIGCSRFDISDYLQSKFAAWEMARFEFPELEGNAIVHGWDYLLKYRASFAETLAGRVKGLLSTGWKYALAGGLNHELLASLNENNQDYFTIGTNKLKFLTWLPATKYSCSGTMEKLFFLFHDNASGLQYRLEVTVTFADGSQKIINPTPLVTCPAYSVVEFKVGFDHLDLVNAWYGHTVKSWEAVLVGPNGDCLSERRTFIHDTRVFDHGKVFFYRNSFSAYDTFRFLGKSELNLEYERLSGSIFREEKYSFFNAPSKQFGAKETQSCKANSGWVSLEEKNCLRELLLSPEAYEQIGKELFQIVVRSAKVTPFLKDGEYLYNLEIDYERSYQNSFFSAHVPESSANPVIPPQTLSWDNMDVSFDDMEITFDQVTF